MTLTGIPRSAMDAHDTLSARGLEHFLGKRSEEWTVEDLLRVAREKDLRLVSLLHVGGDGWLKTLDFAPRSAGHLRDILEGGERADGSSLFAGTGIRPGASDVLLRPRLSSAFLDPFSEQPCLALLCGHAGRDGAPLPESPDTILRRAHERLRREAGVDLWALGEVEYFLGRRSEESPEFGADERGYHATAPFVFGESLRRRALAVLAEIGVPVKYAHSEVGYIAPAGPGDFVWEQHEVELALAPLPEAALGVALTQWVLRQLAAREGMHLSFDPFLRAGHAGSGLHFHFSPVVGGRHAGRAGENGLDDAGRWLVGGLVRHGAALMAFGNRGTASLERLRQAKEAPSRVAWGAYDRGVLVRLPVVARAPDGRETSPPTIEFRLPDGSTQPYYLLAGVAQAVLDGRALADLPEVLARAATDRAPDDTDPRLPRTLPEIAEALDADRAIFEAGGVFPPGLLDHAIATLRG